MKQIISISFISLAGLLLFQSFVPMKVMKKDGAAPGYTGSPGDSFLNCTFCHGGNAVKVDGWITSNIPSSGYVPGNRYTITTTNTEAEGTRFGFEISPQDITGKLLGQIVITDTVQTKLVGSDKYITYTANGVDGNGSKTWTFDWVAPAAGTGDVTFYGGFNSNFDGHKDGDKTFLSTLTVQESGTGATRPLPEEISTFRVFPNPSTYLINLHLNLKHRFNIRIDLMDATGKHVDMLFSGRTDTIIQQYNTADLSPGMYFIQIEINGKIFKEILSVTH